MKHVGLHRFVKHQAVLFIIFPMSWYYRHTRTRSGNYPNFLLATYYSRGDWWVVIDTTCKSLAKWWGMFLGTSHFDLEGWQKNPPVGFFRERIPPWNYK